MKIASVLMSLVFAGVVAHANEPTAPAAGHEAPAATETKKVEEKKVTTHTKKSEKGAAAAAETKEAPAPATPAGH